MKHLYLLYILLSLTLVVHAQNVHIRYDNESLDKILLDLRDGYGIDLSFSNNQLSQYHITIDKNFSNVQEALEFLLTNKSLELQKLGEVYIIKHAIKSEPRLFVLSATVIDKKSGERLPYAHLLINDKPLTTNQDGNFSVKSKSDSLFHVIVNYLGFYICDTTLLASAHNELALRPMTYEIEEIKVSTMLATHKTGEADIPGSIRLNSFVSNYLPGNGDQSVFNLLRLQPGILAAGEQSSDLLIWGSYEGQSKLLFDGITLFNMKNYNDNISTINPLIVKDVSVLKGGYGIDYNGRVGGIVDVTARDGDRHKFSSMLNINNQTLSGKASVPLFQKRATLLVALRQTYYELYDKSNVTLTVGKKESTTVDRTLYPDYNFRDFNLKLSGELSTNTNYKINYLRGKDDFEYALNLDGVQSNFIYEDAEHNIQSGWSAQLNHNWQNGRTSRIRVSGSMLTKNVNNRQQIGGSTSGSRPNGTAAGGTYQTLLNDQIENHIEENNAEIETRTQLGEHHHLKWIIGWNHQQTSYNEDSVNIQIHQLSNKINSINFRMNDSWSITQKLNLNAGIVYNYILDYNKNYWHPRASLNYALLQNLNVSLSYGTYNQFVTQLPEVDDFKKIRYFWMTSDFENISVQKGRHKVLAFNYQHEGLKLNVNLFERNISGLTRYGNYSYQSTPFNGESRSKGFDVLLSKTYRNLNFWLTYSYSKTLEHFDYFLSDEFTRAIHDQRHEAKGALVYTLRNWHFSANYVYGSGFPDVFDNIVKNDYQRLDVAVNRAFKLKKLDINAGFSILNLLNRKNIKYDNFYRLEDEDGEITLQTEAVPFTPTLYFNISF